MKDFIHTTPFFRLLLALIVGIVIAYETAVPSWLFVLLPALIIIGMIIGWRLSNSFRWRWSFGAAALSMVVMIGLWRMHAFQQELTFPAQGMKALFLVKITEPPVEKPKTWLYQVEIKKAFDHEKSMPVHRAAFLYVRKDTLTPPLEMDDQLLVYTTFSPVRSNGNPESFDYSSFLKNQGIVANGFVTKGQYQVIQKSHSFSIYKTSALARASLLNIFKKYHIDGDEFAVVAALMLGYNDALTHELRDSYSISGTMHVLSVSGLHVGIIYAVLFFLFSFTGKSRKALVIKQLVIIVLLWGFAFLTGLAPAVTRATIMFSLMALGMTLERKPRIVNTIFFSAFIMLLYQPTYLFNVSFQLSYVAVLSIVYFEPKFNALIVVHNKALKWIWTLLCVSFAAQLGTSALGIFYFHRFATYFWIGNLIVVPAAAWIMYTGIALLVFSPFPIVAQWIAWVLEWMLRIMNGTIKWIEQIPYASLNGWMDTFQLIVSLVCLITLTAYFQTRQYRWLVISLSMILAITTDSVWRDFQSSKTREAIVFADAENTHIDFIAGKQHVAITSDSSKLADLTKTFYLKHHFSAPQLKHSEYITFKGKHFLITNDTLFPKKTSHGAMLKVDYLIVGNHSRLTFAQWHRFIHPDYVIVDQTISPWYSRNIQQSCDSAGIPCVDIKLHGAYHIRL
ncbi:MAG: ComEC/Rec2 family competence protein [Microbacter sp.]